MKEQVLAEETIDTLATAADLAALHAGLARFWMAAEPVLTRPPDETWRLKFATAMAEIAANIIRHAYPAGTSPGPLQLRLRAYSDRVEACFTDYGIEFVAPSLARAVRALNDDPATLPEGGYGLTLIRALVDKLDYTRTAHGKNLWQLVKWL